MTRENHEDELIARYCAGQDSAPITLMQLLLSAETVGEIDVVLSRASGAAHGGTLQAIADLRRLFEERRGAIAELALILRQNAAEERPVTNPAAGLAQCRALFDRLVRQQAEAAVALYSFGDPALLADCTAEIVAKLEDWNIVHPASRILDLGCGFGRVAAALAPKAGEILGIDLSPEMIAEARRRHGGVANLRFLEADGGGLSAIADTSMDLVLAVDSFPYIVECGLELVARHFAEAARVLNRGGHFLIFNFSYRGDLEQDRADIAGLAAQHDFVVRRDGFRCFTLWDGLAFHLQLAGRRLCGG